MTDSSLTPEPGDYLTDRQRELVEKIKAGITNPLIGSYVFSSMAMVIYSKNAIDEAPVTSHGEQSFIAQLMMFIGDDAPQVLIDIALLFYRTDLTMGQGLRLISEIEYQCNMKLINEANVDPDSFRNMLCEFDSK